MASSRDCGPTLHSHHNGIVQPQTPGPLGVNDRGAPGVPACFGDTPGPVGVNDAADPIHHYVHLSHQAHLVADGAEHLHRLTSHMTTYAESLLRARQIMLAHSKMARDLRLMNRAIRSLENAAAKSGSTKAARKLPELKATYAQAEAIFKSERGAAAQASRLLEVEHKARTSFRGLAEIRVGKAVLRFENALQGSEIGRGLLRTGRIVANPKFTNGLMVVGAVLEGVAGWVDSNAKTTRGKATNAVLAAGAGALIMSDAAVAVGDMLMPKGFKLSEVYQGTAGALAAIGEGFVEGDGDAMAKFHERSKSGDYGIVMQAASEAGDYWARKGLTGGISEFAEAVKYSIQSWQVF